MNFKTRLAETKDKKRVLEIFNNQYADNPFISYINKFFNLDPSVFIEVVEVNKFVVAVGILEFFETENGLEMYGMIGVVDPAYRLMGALKAMRKFYMEFARKKRAVRVYRKHQKNAIHVNTEREIKNGWKVSDAGNNENLIEKFLVYEN